MFGGDLEIHRNPAFAPVTIAAKGWRISCPIEAVITPMAENCETRASSEWASRSANSERLRTRMSPSKRPSLVTAAIKVALNGRILVEYISKTANTSSSIVIGTVSDDLKPKAFAFSTPTKSLVARSSIQIGARYCQPTAGRLLSLFFQLRLMLKE